MDRQKQDFLNILNAYVNKTTITLETPDYNEIFRLAKINSLEAIIYSTLKENKIVPDSVDVTHLENIFNATVMYSVKQEYVTNEVVKILAANEVRHLLFKGIVIKKFYSDPDLRTMGDIDIYIDVDDRDKVKNILLENGYKIDEVNSHANVWNYKKNNVVIEMHTVLFERDLHQDISLRDYYKTPFALAVKEAEYSYVFTIENHLIYMLLHMAKHFVNGGCGIRMLVDIAFALKKNNVLDWSYIKGELQKNNIYQFAVNMFSLSAELFGTKQPFEKNENTLDYILEYMINGGVFGYEGKNIDAIRTAKRMEGKGNILRLIFPSYIDITTRYEWANRYPRFLLPLCWIKMWFYRLFVVKENSFKRVIEMAKNSNDAVTHKKMLELVGLHKE